MDNKEQRKENKNSKDKRKMQEGKNTREGGRRADGKSIRADERRVDEQRADGKSIRADGRRADGKSIRADGRRADGKSITDDRERGRKRKKDSKEKKKSSLVLNIILVIASCIFVFALVQLIRSFLPYFQGGAEYDDIKDQVITTQEDPKGKAAGETKAEGFSVDFEQLLALNPDTVAWIRFDEPAVISYPVVKGTDNEEYLTRTFQANDNKLGAIFMDYEAAPDFTDRNTIIYGHNLNYGGEMFSQLTEYESQSFYEQHPYFYIYTPDNKVRTYRIYAAGVVSDVSDNYIHKFNSDEEFETYLNTVKTSSAYNTGTEAMKDSKIVTLSTCTNINDADRFVIHGVLQETKDIE